MGLLLASRSLFGLLPEKRFQNQRFAGDCPETENRVTGFRQGGFSRRCQNPVCFQSFQWLGRKGYEISTRCENVRRTPKSCPDSGAISAHAKAQTGRRKDVPDRVRV
jgi:hypothetical protein